MQMQPCPFCGEAQRLGVKTSREIRHVLAGDLVIFTSFCRCNRCRARGPVKRFDAIYSLDKLNEIDDAVFNLKQATIAAWNTLHITWRVALEASTTNWESEYVQ